MADTNEPVNNHAGAESGLNVGFGVLPDPTLRKEKALELSEIKIGEQYVYYPPKENVDDNRHFPAKVEAVADRVRVRIFMESAPDGVLCSVSARRLEMQHELL